MAVTGALIAVAATVGTTMYSRSAQRDAKIQANHQEATAKQNVANTAAQKEATMAARAQRAQQQAMAGGGYDSTINTSPLGLAGGTEPKDKLGA
jgi:uncharacterized protein HemX